MTPSTLKIISFKFLSSPAMTSLILGSWVLNRILNIPPRSWEAGPPVLTVTPYVKMVTCLHMKSLAWCSEDVLVSKFRTLGCKTEEEISLVSIGLLESEHKFSILLNILWDSFFHSYMAAENVETMLLGILTFLLCGLTTRGGGKL
ncbi:unnamed protein product [Lactuca saligna]|uniref:Uncharacterized protein n=1 Tax=Lactuca saligna TaxID=75948 RepID=A0AA35VAM0_LACSI|nr:unnamed protein product [Lactuca saligna]